MSKTSNDGIDIDNFDYADYASALESEHSSSTDCEMDSENPENVWTPACRYKKKEGLCVPLKPDYV